MSGSGRQPPAARRSEAGRATRVDRTSAVSRTDSADTMVVRALVTSSAGTRGGPAAARRPRGSHRARPKATPGDAPVSRTGTGPARRGCEACGATRYQTAAGVSNPRLNSAGPLSGCGRKTTVSASSRRQGRFRRGRGPRLRHVHAANGVCRPREAAAGHREHEEQTVGDEDAVIGEDLHAPSEPVVVPSGRIPNNIVPTGRAVRRRARRKSSPRPRSGRVPRLLRWGPHGMARSPRRRPQHGRRCPSRCAAGRPPRRPARAGPQHPTRLGREGGRGRRSQVILLGQTLEP